MRRILDKGVSWQVFLAIVGLASVSFAETRTTYTVDPARSELVVQLFKAGVGSALAHDHIVRATAFVGQVQLDLTTPANGAIAVEVQTASLAVDEPEMRKKYSLASRLSDKDRQQIQETMQSSSQLAVVQYPTMTFTSTRIEARTPGTYAVTGNLVIRGITQKVNFLVQLEPNGKALHAKGSFRFKQSLFGYQPYSALLGAVRNEDEVLLHFDVLATP